MTKFRGAAAATAAISLLLACSGGDPEDVSESQQTIIGGTKFPVADPNPYNVVKIVNRTGATKYELGSGILLNSEWVLTAAHVVWDCGAGTVQTPSWVSVTLEGKGPAQLVEAKEIVAHPSFHYESKAYCPQLMGAGIDVALIRLKHPLKTISPFVAFSSALSLPAEALIAGYGPWDSANLSSYGLTSAEWDIDATHKKDGKADAQALALHPTWRGYPQEFWVPPYYSETWVHNWYGDSGGPIFTTIGGVPEIIGVIEGGSWDGAVRPASGTYELPGYSVAESIEAFRAWAVLAKDTRIPHRIYNFDDPQSGRTRDDAVFLDCDGTLRVQFFFGEGGNAWAWHVPTPPAGIPAFPPCANQRKTASAGDISGDSISDLVLTIDNSAYALRGKVDASEPVVGRSFDVTSNVALSSSDVVTADAIDINGTTAKEVVFSYADGTQQVFNASSTGVLTGDSASKRVSYGDFDGDGLGDTSRIYTKAGAHTYDLYVDYVLGNGTKAVSNPMNSWLTSGSVPVRTYVGNFNGDVGAEARALTDYVIEFDGKLSLCAAKDVGVPVCSSPGSLYANTQPATWAEVRDANYDGYDDLEVRLADGSERLFWGKASGLTASNYAPVVVLTNGDSQGEETIGSGVLIAPNWVLTDSRLVDSPRTNPKYVSFTWDNGTTTATANALAVYVDSKGAALVRLASAFTGAPTSAIPAGAVQAWAEGIKNNCGSTLPSNNEFCSAECPCVYAASDCDTDAECSAGNVCTEEFGPSFGFAPNWFVCVPPACASYPRGHKDHCSEECPCGLGGGDCDYEGTDVQCLEGFTCATNFGSAFGMESDRDVCVPTVCHDRTATDAQFAGDNYCEPGCPCGLGGGDCDPLDKGPGNNGGCLPGLACATNYGAAFGLPIGHEVCVPSGCEEGKRVAEEGEFGEKQFCTAACPCGLGGGDCDTEDVVTGCLPGLVCAKNYGAAFGLPPGHEVCVPSGCEEGKRVAEEGEFGEKQFCTAACPCGLGGGDCDDGTCLPGLECRKDIGKAFGIEPTYEVCVPAGCQTGTMFTADYCTDACPCGQGGGNCASDEGCLPGLKCGTNKICYRP